MLFSSILPHALPLLEIASLKQVQNASERHLNCPCYKWLKFSHIHKLDLVIYTLHHILIKYQMKTYFSFFNIIIFESTKFWECVKSVFDATKDCMWQVMIDEQFSDKRLETLFTDAQMDRMQIQTKEGKRPTSMQTSRTF